MSVGTHRFTPSSRHRLRAESSLAMGAVHACRQSKPNPSCVGADRARYRLPWSLAPTRGRGGFEMPEDPDEDAAARRLPKPGHSSDGQAEGGQCRSAIRRWFPTPFTLGDPGHGPFAHTPLRESPEASRGPELTLFASRDQSRRRCSSPQAAQTGSQCGPDLTDRRTVGRANADRPSGRWPDAIYLGRSRPWAIRSMSEEQRTALPIDKEVPAALDVHLVVETSTPRCARGWPGTRASMCISGLGQSDREAYRPYGPRESSRRNSLAGGHELRSVARDARWRIPAGLPDTVGFRLQR